MSSKQLLPVEQETQAAAERLKAQIEDALSIVFNSSSESTEELTARADRLDRAARDLVVALREVARRRAGASPD